MQDTLYYKDNYLMEFKTTVVNCIEESGKYKVILEDTAFYPEGGGQNADIGLIDNINVTDVQEKNKELKHQNTILKNQIFELEISNKKIDENQFLITENLDSNEMRILCTKLQDKAMDIAGVFAKENNIYRFQIMSKKSDLNQVTNELRSMYNAKGGGNSNAIQGQINVKDEQIGEIINMIENI